MNTIHDQTDFPALRDAEFMLLTTFRRNEVPVHTTVWFAQAGDRLFVTTMDQAGKAKRIRATGRVAVAPSTRTGEVLGPAVKAEGRQLPPEEFPEAVAALRAKYPMFDQIAGRSEGGADQRIYLEIRPDGSADRA
jgi:PPOX class probable F420-dependent enzyme